MKMRSRFFQALLCVGLLITKQSVAEQSSHVDARIFTAEDRFNAECSFAAYHRSTCPVWFARLAAQPEKYHGRVVNIVGFLAVDFGELAIYASESDYEHRIDGASIRVKVSEPEAAKFIQQKLYSSVRVIGYFDATEFTKERPRLGLITAIGGLASVDDRRIEREREIYIRAEDLGLDDENED